MDNNTAPVVKKRYYAIRSRGRANSGISFSASMDNNTAPELDKRYYAIRELANSGMSFSAIMDSDIEPEVDKRYYAIRERANSGISFSAIMDNDTAPVVKKRYYAIRGRAGVNKTRYNPYKHRRLQATGRDISRSAPRETTEPEKEEIAKAYRRHLKARRKLLHMETCVDEFKNSLRNYLFEDESAMEEANLGLHPENEATTTRNISFKQ